LKARCGSARLRQSNEQVEDVMFASLPVRLARAVLKLARVPECGDRSVRLVITQRELSQMIGVSLREHQQAAAHLAKARLDQARPCGNTVLNAVALSRIKEKR
jgi:CRP-like cAMP-binding protein